jgi:kinesin family member 5
MLGPEDVIASLLSEEPISETTQESFGVIPRSVDTIFDSVYSEGIGKGVKFTMKVSYIEVYMESINDILTSPPTTNLRIREYPRLGMVVVGLEERFVTCTEDVYECLATGSHNRIVGATNQNQRSSRSHTVFIITLEQKFVDGSSKLSKLNLVDLVGLVLIS